MINENALLHILESKENISIIELKQIIETLTYKNIPKAKSQPEAILFYYIHKYVDKEVKVNEFRIGKFVTDIYFNFNNIKYVIEFDSLSYHSSKEDIEKDLEKIKYLKKME